MVHMSSEVVILMLSFTDTILDGEQFTSGNLKDDYLELRCLPTSSAPSSSGATGGRWRSSCRCASRIVAVGTPNLAAYLLLHDVNPWPIWSDGAV